MNSYGEIFVGKNFDAILLQKFEVRNSKFETNSNYQNLKFKTNCRLNSKAGERGKKHKISIKGASLKNKSQKEKA